MFSSLAPRLGEFQELAALVEILHLEPEALTWFLERFDMYLMDLQSYTLTKVEPSQSANLQAMLATKRYYPQDAVIRIKKTAKSAAHAEAPAPPLPWPGLVRWA